MSDRFDDELIQQLQAANPHVGPRDTPDPHTSAEARFEEIVMQPHNTLKRPETEPTRTSEPRAGSSRPWWRGPLVVAPLGVLLAAVLAGGFIAFPGASSAQAQVVAAAEQTASFGTGRVVVEFDYEGEGVPEDAPIASLDYRYDGADYSLVGEGIELVMTQDGESYPGRVEIVKVDDVLYEPVVDTDGLVGYTESVGGEIDGLETDALLKPSNMDPRTIATIAERSSDFEQIGSTGGVTSFAGTLTDEDISDIPADNLPPGLSLIADELGGIDVNVSVKDGVVESLAFSFETDTPDGPLEGTITTTVSELGEPQTITRPPLDSMLVFDGENFRPVTESELAMEQELMALFNDLEARRPDLCVNLPEGADEGDVISDQALEEYLSCLEAEGEGRVADAYRALHGG